MTFLLLSHSYKHLRCTYLIVPAHLHGEKRGFSCSLSSDKQILQRGMPLLPYDVSLTTIGSPNSPILGRITLEGKDTY